MSFCANILFSEPVITVFYTGIVHFLFHFNGSTLIWITRRSAAPPPPPAPTTAACTKPVIMSPLSERNLVLLSCIYLLFSSCLPPVLLLPTSSYPPVYLLFSSCLPPVILLSTPCYPPAYLLLSSYLPPVLLLPTSCSPPAYLLLSSCLPHFPPATFKCLSITTPFYCNFRSGFTSDIV